jgi:hypothetical protein
VRTWILPIVLAACEHGQTPPGMDGGDNPDGGTPACGKESLIGGELIDWDSSDADFLGIANATISLRFDPSSFSTTTPPNGRIELCGRPDLPLEFAIDAPGDYLDGTLAIERDVALSGEAISLRMFTAARAATFFSEHGLIFDPNKAQVVVLMTADRAALSIDAAHDTALAGNDDLGGAEVTWSAGTSGRYVLFPNVDVADSSVTITGDLMSGPRAAPIAPGTLSLVAISFVFVGP